jgi:hypothetical protein
MAAQASDWQTQQRVFNNSLAITTGLTFAIVTVEALKR